MSDIVSGESATPRMQKAREHSALRILLYHPKVVCGLVLVGILVFVAIFAPVLSPYDPTKTSLKNKLESPSSSHILGTDYLGRDVLSRILYGAQTTLTITFLVVGLSLVIGILLGMIAGYYGGIADSILSRAIDIFLPFPGILIALPMLAFMSPGILAMVIALTLNNWTTFARLIRNETYAIKNREFIHSARLSGLSDTRIMFRHLLPSIISPVIVLATIDIGSTILHISSLSFLGLGIPPNLPEWGAMVSSGKDFIRLAPLQTIIPGLVITSVVLLFNILGEEIRGMLNPASKEGLEL